MSRIDHHPPGTDSHKGPSGRVAHRIRVRLFGGDPKADSQDRLNGTYEAKEDGELAEILDRLRRYDELMGELPLDPAERMARVGELEECGALEEWDIVDSAMRRFVLGRLGHGVQRSHKNSSGDLLLEFEFHNGLPVFLLGSTSLSGSYAKTLEGAFRHLLEYADWLNGESKAS